MKLFGEKLLREFFSNKVSQLKWEIKGLNYKDPENIDIQELSEKIFEDFKLEHISIVLENRTVDVNMVSVDGSQFPRQYDVERGKKYECARVKYIFSLPKNIEYLQYTPSHFEPNRTEYISDRQKIYFYYQTLYGNIVLSDEIKKEVKLWITNLQEHIQDGVIAINNDINRYNEEIKNLIPTLISEKVNEIIKLNNQNQDLNDL